MCDEGDGEDDSPDARGPYETWRSLDPWHCALMNILVSHVDNNPYARLWFAVIEQAVLDLYVLNGAGMDPQDLKWFRSGWCRRFLRSQRFTAICGACGLDPAWTRQCIASYARTLDETRQARRTAA
ncbi:MAG: hypothetical protein Q8N51_00765 [Gammaproteobacteria bacterium]|nr:hypothetical protein [Gammaproteobacteria bacterium]